MTPRISIITITFNSAATLENTISSVLAQDYPALEYLIIDGGSTDGTLDIVEKYRDRIATVVSEPDKGISDAFNKGIRLATGEIIGIINSDDILLPGALQAIADSYEPDVDVYRGSIVVRNPDTGYGFSYSPSLQCRPRDYLRMHVCHQGTFVRADAYARVGWYDTSVRYIMDIDMLFRLYGSGCRFKEVPCDLAEFTLGGATSDAFYKKVRERYRVVRQNGGSVLLSLYISVYCCVKDMLKLLIDKLFGVDFKNKLRGRKKQ